MATSFHNKIVIITGSSSGIGAATALRFAQLGAAGVVIHGRQEAALKQVKDRLEQAGQGTTKVHIVVGDITDEKVRENLINETIGKFGKLDVLVNNAGFCNSPQLTSETPIDIYDKLIGVNIRSVVVLTQLAIPHLVKSKGNVVNISSVGGIKSLHLFTFYGMTKIAMDHFTRCLAVELGPQGVRVNSVNPGAFPETELASRTGVSQDMIKEHMNQVVPVTPLRRVGKLEEVADAITFLASDRASFITGTRQVVDGGITLT